MRRIPALLALFSLVFASPAEAWSTRVQINASTKAWQIVADRDGPIVVTIATTARGEINPKIVVVDESLVRCAGVGAENVARCEFPATAGERYTIGVASTGKPVMAIIHATSPGGDRSRREILSPAILEDAMRALR